VGGVGVDVDAPETAEDRVVLATLGGRSKVADFFPLRIVGVSFWCGDTAPWYVEVRVVWVLPYV
jgi:hypothetical protein